MDGPAKTEQAANERQATSMFPGSVSDVQTMEPGVEDSKDKEATVDAHGVDQEHKKNDSLGQESQLKAANENDTPTAEQELSAQRAKAENDKKIFDAQERVRRRHRLAAEQKAAADEAIRKSRESKPLTMPGDASGDLGGSYSSWGASSVVVSSDSIDDMTGDEEEGDDSMEIYDGEYS